MKKLLLTLLMSTPIVMLNAQKNPNAFLNNWSGPYGGVPAFSDYKLKDFKVAIYTAIQEKLDEYKTISANPNPPTFENTIVAMERAGKKLSQIKAVFDIYGSNLNSPEFEPIETELTPLFPKQTIKFFKTNHYLTESQLFIIHPIRVN